MYFLFSKAISLFVSPFWWFLLVFLYSFVVRNPKNKKRSAYLSFIILLMFSNPFLINEAFLAWEIPATSFAKTPEYEVGIVLTGVTEDYRSPKDRIYFKKGADRVFHTLKLYKEGKIKRILISGAEFDYVGNLIETDRNLKQVFIDCGVPDSVLMTETRSRNTHENALFSKEILQKNFPNQKYLLITSAFHLRRAQACFGKENLDVEVFSTDFYSIDQTSYLIPSEKALVEWSILFREMLGYLSYKILGYA